MTYEREVPLARYTSFRIGGPAKRMAFPKDGSQMVLLIAFARSCGARPLVVGNASVLGEIGDVVILGNSEDHLFYFVCRSAVGFIG